jgi:two-component system, LuxR family, response regulator FixJ
MPTPVVLIVDDDQAVRNSLKFSLEIEGFAVRTYGGPEDLLVDPDLPEHGCLVLDYRLPGMSGLQLLGKLRERNVMLPALLITTHPSRAVRGEASRAGVLLIEKPLLGESLMDGIRQAIGHDLNRLN